MRELSLNILDLAQNSVTAQATFIEMILDVSRAKNTLKIIIRDDGIGMDKDFAQSIADPFSTTRTSRKVGLGVPLFRMAAEQTGGSLSVDSKKGVGTSVEALFHTESIDYTPLGNIGSTISLLIGANLETRFRLHCIVDEVDAFTFDTNEVKKILEEVPLDTPEVILWMKKDINENINSHIGGAV